MLDATIKYVLLLQKDHRIFSIKMVPQIKGPNLKEHFLGFKILGKVRVFLYSLIDIEYNICMYVILFAPLVTVED